MAKRKPKASIRYWTCEPMTDDVKSTIERLRNTRDVKHVAVMPDVHQAGDVCVGTVMATSNLIYPQAIGGDIGCGMAAVAFNASADVLASKRDAESLLHALKSVTPVFKRADPVDDPWLSQTTLRAKHLNRIKNREGRVQLGTLGRGNHFIEFQADHDDRLWLMVHSGSRAMGQAVRDWYVDRAQGTSGGLRYLSATTPLGQAYLYDVGWARAYAERNRQCMVLKVYQLMQRLFGVEMDFRTWIRTDHNHVRLENHACSRLWVDRKSVV